MCQASQRQRHGPQTCALASSTWAGTSPGGECTVYGLCYSGSLGSALMWQGPRRMSVGAEPCVSSHLSGPMQPHRGAHHARAQGVRFHAISERLVRGRCARTFALQRCRSLAGEKQIGMNRLRRDHAGSQDLRVTRAMDGASAAWELQRQSLALRRPHRAGGCPAQVRARARRCSPLSSRATHGITCRCVGWALRRRPRSNNFGRAPLPFKRQPLPRCS